MKLYSWFLLNYPNLRMIYFSSYFSHYKEKNFNIRYQGVTVTKRQNYFNIESKNGARLIIFNIDEEWTSIRGCRASGVFLDLYNDFEKYRNIILPFLVAPNMNDTTPAPFVYLLDENEFLCGENNFKL